MAKNKVNAKHLMNQGSTKRAYEKRQRQTREKPSKDLTIHQSAILKYLLMEYPAPKPRLDCFQDVSKGDKSQMAELYQATNELSNHGMIARLPFDFLMLTDLGKRLAMKLVEGKGS